MNNVLKELYLKGIFKKMKDISAYTDSNHFHTITIIKA
jgi:hypothetical protein